MKKVQKEMISNDFIAFIGKVSNCCCYKYKYVLAYKSVLKYYNNKR